MSEQGRNLFAEKKGRNLFGEEPTYGEAALTMATGALAEPVAGLAGIAQSINPMADAGAGANAVARTREALTYQPRSESGQAGLQQVGNFVEPLTSAFQTAEQKLGDAGYNLAGPVGGAVGASVPTLLAEVIGLKGVKSLGKVDASGVKRLVDERISQALDRPVIAIGDDGRFSAETLGIIQQSKPELLEQAERFNLFQDLGVTPTRANVTRSTDDFRIQQEARKESGPVSEVIAGQDQQLIDGVNKRTPGIAKDVGEANASVLSVVDDTVDKLEETVSNAYKAARSASDSDAVVKIDNTIDAVRRSMKFNQRSNGTTVAIRGILEERGLVKGFKQKDGVGLRVNEAERLRQDLNQLFDGANADGRRVIRTIKDALDEDVFSVAGEDVFKPARQAKIDMQKRIEKAKRNHRDKTRGSLLEDIIDNQVGAEQIFDKLTNPATRLDDFVSVKQFLLDSGDAGAKAWDNIRGQAFREALEKATKSFTQGENGQVVFNAREFTNRLNRLRLRRSGESSKFNELFTPEEIEFIDKVKEVGILRTPVATTISGEGPSARIVQLLKQKVGNIPVVGPIAQILNLPFSVVRDARRTRQVLDPVSGIVR